MLVETSAAAPFHIPSASLTTHHSDYDQFWKDNFSRLLVQSCSSRNEAASSFCDLKLSPGPGAAATGSIWAHRALLSRVSAYFAGILLSSDKEEEDVIQILVPDCSLQSLETFVKICYEGKVEEIEENVQVKYNQL